MHRRTFLRGVGVTMALPWLESVPVWGADTVTKAGVAPLPKRFAALFMGCGVNGLHFWAKGAGADMELGKSLEPLAKLKTKNIGILITDHNVNETLSIVDRAYLLFEGKILKSGTAEELAADEQVRRVYLGKHFELKRKV